MKTAGVDVGKQFLDIAVSGSARSFRVANTKAGIAKAVQKLSKLVGVAPMAKDSGQSQGKRRIRGGRAQVRVALYMATLSAVRWDPEMKAHYQQLRGRGKVGKVALVACMRKLLGIVNARRRDEIAADQLQAV